jgi:hypothetical protein
VVFPFDRSLCPLDILRATQPEARLLLCTVNL